MTMYIIAVIFFVIFDRLFKFLAVNHFFDQPRQIIDHVLFINFSRNYNIAFSLPISGWGLNLLIFFITICLLYSLLFLLKKQDYRKVPYLILIILGAVSNLADRMQHGFVIDYLDLKYFTIFNIADIMIVGGVIGLIFKAIKTKKTAGPRLGPV